MDERFSLSSFIKRFPDNESCIEEIRRIKYSGGILCKYCERITKHYKLINRPVYECKFCRRQVYPLVGTIYEKSSTDLRTWFMAIFILTQTRGDISIRSLQKELGVTYKTAWRIYNKLHLLMERNKGDLLTDTRIKKWVIWNAIELKVTQKS